MSVDTATNRLNIKALQKRLYTEAGISKNVRYALQNLLRFTVFYIKIGKFKKR